MVNTAVTRRRFLSGTALAAGAVALAACTAGPSGPQATKSAATSAAKGSRTEVLPAPKSFRQAPALDGQGLPPVEERLPKVPYVVPHKWVTEGQYGGRLNMSVFSTSGAATADADREFFYGHSPLRYLNDGLDIGPGLVESWESNDDASEWTFHFRQGLRWSDGEPWTTENILWWWEKFILEQKMGQSPPDETRSGNGTLAEFTAVDETTLTLTFDGPAPLTADRMAMWVNGNVGKNGPIWVMPSHYLRQFHPDSGNDIPDDWDTVGGLMESKADWHRNPDCPTMTGYTCKSFDNNSGVVLERNPYYWCVMPNGDQLPYIDEININVVSDAEAGKLQVQQGNVDFWQGSFNHATLSDIEGIRNNAEKAGTKVILWDSGSGTGSIFFFNYDHPDDQLRKLIREPKFRQAISYAFDREAVRKSVYFNTGEPTTGTMSPKALEFNVNDQGKRAYTDWRDSYVEYDPDKASSILDELGLKDTDGDGVREFPDGQKLSLRLDFQADQSADHKAKDAQLVSDLKAVGLELALNPIAPQTYDDQWQTGQLMAHSNWEVGGAPNLLSQPQWLVPIEGQRWAPLQGQWYQLLGTETEGTELDLDPWERHPPRMEAEPGGPIAKLWDLYNQSKLESDEMKRHQLVWEIVKIHISDGPFFMGCTANYPQPIVIKKDLGNVPEQQHLALGGFVNPWVHPTPAVYDPECFFWQNPDQHS